jgi:hypothetical protein
MSNRRRADRFVIPEASEGTLRVMQDVFVESTSATQVVLVSDMPLPRDEHLFLELPRELGSRSVVPAQVHKSAPLWSGETRRHRIDLIVEATRDMPAAVSRPALGVLIRIVPVRIRDVSAAGCLLESEGPLPEGAVGLLELTIDGESQSETLRICRSTQMPGSPWPWRSGAHFLTLGAPESSSVRNVVARFEILGEIGVMPAALRRMARRPPLVHR